LNLLDLQFEKTMCALSTFYDPYDPL